jgi:hypothetical protein
LAQEGVSCTDFQLSGLVDQISQALKWLNHHCEGIYLKNRVRWYLRQCDRVPVEFLAKVVRLQRQTCVRRRLLRRLYALRRGTGPTSSILAGSRKGKRNKKRQRSCRHCDCPQ